MDSQMTNIPEIVDKKYLYDEEGKKHDLTEFHQLFIPYSRYAINKEGYLLKIDKGKIFKAKYKNEYGYYQTNLQSDGCNSRKQNTANIHRLLAVTFLPNPDPSTKNDIIFKDGNTSNYALSNLQWASKSELMLHRKKLNSYIHLYKPVRVINLITKEETIFNTLPEVANYLNFHVETIRKALRKEKPICNYKLEYVNAEHKTKHKDVEKNRIHNSTFDKRYIVTKQGQIYSKSSGDELKPVKDEKGYLQITLIDDNDLRTTIRVHRLVAKKYVPNNSPNNKDQVNHIDMNKENNHYKNLEWCTNLENMRHRHQLNKNKYVENFIEVN